MSKRTIGLFTLTLLMTGAIDSVRNLPTTALFGPSLIFFFIVGAIFFLLPTGFISAELTSMFKDKGGIFDWTTMAFGEKIGVLAIWLQWINTMAWYPTILSFIAGTATYLIDPSLAQNKVYLVSVILGVFWLLTIINLRGLRVSAIFASWSGLIGMVIPMMLIVVLGLIWIFTGKPLQIHFTWHALLPHLDKSTNWISLTAIITSFLGMELAAVHVKQINNPQKTFPKALMISVGFILVSMILGSLAIAVVLPANDINLVDGIMEAFNQFLSYYHLAYLLPVLTIMILLGSLGGIINWLISPAKGLMQAAELGYLPKIFAQQNKHGVSSAVLIAQAILVTFVCLAFLFMPSVNGSYWLLTDLSTELYLIMYILMFAAALTLKIKNKHLTPSFQVPGKKFGFYTLGIFGILGCLVSLYVGFLPPSNIDVGSDLHYVITFSTSMVIMVLPIFGLYGYKRFRRC
jgi:amino acid transporter